MSSARFELLNHPLKLQIYVASGVSRKLARRMLRRAANNRRRALVRENPRAFIAYLIREVIRNRDTKSYVAVDIDTGPAELVFQIDVGKRGPTIKFIENDVVRYDGFFYKFIGSTVVVKRARRTGNKVKRSARIEAIRAAYYKKHHCYPEAPKTVKRSYDWQHEKMQKQQDAYVKQFGAISKGHLRRKIRKKLLTSNSAPKPFDRRAHYTTPPENVDPPQED